MYQYASRDLLDVKSHIAKNFNVIASLRGSEEVSPEEFMLSDSIQEPHSYYSAHAAIAIVPYLL